MVPHGGTSIGLHGLGWLKTPQSKAPSNVFPETSKACVCLHFKKEGQLAREESVLRMQFTVLVRIMAASWPYWNTSA